MVWMSYRYGVGGNLISDAAWARFEKVRKPCKEECKNPMMVWMRAGGDHGCCGGIQVAEQVTHTMELIRFLESEPEHVQQLAALDHPIQEIEHVLGVDRSQTHFCAKPDGIVMQKFNKGPTFKSTTNDKTRARFIIPHDVVLSEGDINLTPYVAPAPALPPADDSGDDSDSDDGLPIAQMLEKKPNDTCIDHAAADDTSSLEAVLGKIPMFANELPLVEQAMVDYGHTIEASPIVHPEIAGRGVEHAHGRAAWYYRSKCEGKVDAMEDLCRRACQKKNTPQALGAKFERRTRDYTRCYRMGVMSKDLEKMRKEIKTHRNMKDYHQKFIESEVTDDDTDVHILTPASVCDGTPPMGEVLATGKYRGETFALTSATSLGVPFPEYDFHFECDWTMNPFSHLAFWV